MNANAEQSKELNLESIRRTDLAAERTWLAWWRTGIASTATGIAVGGVIPRLITTDSRIWFVALGCGYVLIGISIFVAAYRRQMSVLSSIHDERPISVNPRVVLWLTVAGIALALGTIAAVIAAD